MDKTIQQQLWYEAIMTRMRECDTAEESVAYANTLVDGYEAKFNVNPPAPAAQE